MSPQPLTLSETFNQLHHSKPSAMGSQPIHTPTRVGNSIRKTRLVNEPAYFNPARNATTSAGSNSRYLQQYLLNLQPAASYGADSRSLPKQNVSITDLPTPSDVLNPSPVKRPPRVKETAAIDGTSNDDKQLSTPSEIVTRSTSRGSLSDCTSAQQRNTTGSAARRRSRSIKKALLDKDLPPLPAPPPFENSGHILGPECQNEQTQLDAALYPKARPKALESKLEDSERPQASSELRHEVSFDLSFSHAF